MRVKGRNVRLFMQGDLTDANRWLPYAQARLAEHPAFAAGRIFKQSYQFGGTRITAGRDTGDQLFIRINAQGDHGAILLIPHTHEHPQGWGKPFADEGGQKINPPLGTPAPQDQRNTVLFVDKTKTLDHELEPKIQQRAPKLAVGNLQESLKTGGHWWYVSWFGPSNQLVHDSDEQLLRAAPAIGTGGYPLNLPSKLYQRAFFVNGKRYTTQHYVLSAKLARKPKPDDETTKQTVVFLLLALTDEWDRFRVVYAPLAKVNAKDDTKTPWIIASEFDALDTLAVENGRMVGGRDVAHEPSSPFGTIIQSSVWRFAKDCTAVSCIAAMVGMPDGSLMLAYRETLDSPIDQGYITRRLNQGVGTWVAPMVSPLFLVQRYRVGLDLTTPDSVPVVTRLDAAMPDAATPYELVSTARDLILGSITLNLHDIFGRPVGLFTDNAHAAHIRYREVVTVDIDVDYATGYSGENPQPYRIVGRVESYINEDRLDDVAGLIFGPPPPFDSMEWVRYQLWQNQMYTDFFTWPRNATVKLRVDLRLRRGEGDTDLGRVIDTDIDSTIHWTIFDPAALPEDATDDKNITITSPKNKAEWWYPLAITDQVQPDSAIPCFAYVVASAQGDTSELPVFTIPAKTELAVHIDGEDKDHREFTAWEWKLQGPWVANAVLTNREAVLAAQGQQQVIAAIYAPQVLAGFARPPKYPHTLLSLFVQGKTSHDDFTVNIYGERDIPSIVGIPEGAPGDTLPGFYPLNCV